MPLGGPELGGPVVLVDVVAVGGVVPPAPVADDVVAVGRAGCFGLGAMNLCLFLLGALALCTLCVGLVEGLTTAICSPPLTADDREGDDVVRGFASTSPDPYR